MLQPFWLDWKLKLGVEIDYPKPRSIGADRLANAAAVTALYGCPAIVVDFGTATNFVAPSGAVINGYQREAGTTGQVTGLYYMYLQVYDPVRGWVGFSG